MGLKPDDIENKVNVKRVRDFPGASHRRHRVMRMVTLVHEMARRNAKYGLLTICGGGGLGIACVVARK